MIAMVGSILAASLLGSAHCAGMCGGFVVFYSGQSGDSRRGLAHAAYNGGRLVSYATIGALAGGLGSGIQHAGARIGVSHAAAIVSGGIVVLLGGAPIRRALGAAGSRPRGLPVPQGGVAGAVA